MNRRSNRHNRRTAQTEPTGFREDLLVELWIRMAQPSDRSRCGPHIPAPAPSIGRFRSCSSTHRAECCSNDDPRPRVASPDSGPYLLRAPGSRAVSGGGREIPSGAGDRSAMRFSPGCGYLHLPGP